jgi:hypothetical protein
MKPEDLDFIKLNLSSNSQITDEQIQQVFCNHQENLLETLCYFLNIQQEEPKKKTEWEERREICDAYDAEMQKMLKKK